jgi:hypothetical protein
LKEGRGDKSQYRSSLLQKTLQAFRVIWNRNITDELRKELSSVEQRLHLHATISVKVKLEKHEIQLNDVLATLNGHTRGWLTSESFLADFKQLNAHCEEIKEQQILGDQLATRRHLEILACLDIVHVESSARSSNVWSLKHEQANLVLDQILASLWFPSYMIVRKAF